MGERARVVKPTSGAATALRQEPRRKRQRHAEGVERAAETAVSDRPTLFSGSGASDASPPPSPSPSSGHSLGRVPVLPPPAIVDISAPDDRAEHEAERAADVVARRVSGASDGGGDAVLALGAAAPRLWRAADPDAAPGHTAGLIVDDEAQVLSSGQMRKSELLAALRVDACAAADRALAAVGRDTRGCPYVERWLGYYANKPAQHLERAIRKYAPETQSARSAKDYVPAVSARIGRGAAAYAQTGRLPADLPEELKRAALGGGMLGAFAAVGSAIGAALSGLGHAIGSLFAKPREGGAQLGVDRAALHDRLGPGRPLDGPLRAKMESAFDASFANVRVHHDGRAAALSNDLRARAFTLGDHIAFGADEYRPGTLVGDALLAHELAHVVQQSGGAPVERPHVDATPQAALEDEADQAAAAAVLDMHDRGPRKQRLRRDIGRQRGLRLQRCGGGTDLRKGTSLPTSAQQTNIRSDLDFPVEITHTADQPAPAAPAGVSATAAAASTEWAGAKHAGDTAAQTAAADAKRAEIKTELLHGIQAEFDRQLKDAKKTQGTAGKTTIDEFEGAANAAKRVIDDRYSDFLAGGISVGAPRPGEFHAGSNLLSSYDVAARKAHGTFATPETRVYNLATYTGPHGEPSAATKLRAAPYFFNINRNEGDVTVDPLNREGLFFAKEVRDPFAAAHKNDLDLITQYNYAVTDQGGQTVLISPDSPSRGSKWSAFAVTAHEYLHLLTHPIFSAAATKTMNEGFTEYFTYEAMTALPWQQAGNDDSLRRQVEAPDPGLPFSFVDPYKSPPTYQGYADAARKAKSELGSGEGAENAVRGAFFQGHVELLGFDPKDPGKKGPVASANLAKGQREHIVVASGGAVENGAIIAKVHDVKLEDLKKANPGVDLDKLKAGDRVIVPK